MTGTLSLYRNVLLPTVEMPVSVSMHFAVCVVISLFGCIDSGCLRAHVKQRKEVIFQNSIRK